MALVARLELRPAMSRTPGARAYRTVRLSGDEPVNAGGLTLLEASRLARDGDTAASFAMFRTAFQMVEAEGRPSDLILVRGEDGPVYFPVMNVVRFYICEVQDEPRAEEPPPLEDQH